MASYDVSESILIVFDIFVILYKIALYGNIKPNEEEPVAFSLVLKAAIGENDYGKQRYSKSDDQIKQRPE